MPTQNEEKQTTINPLMLVLVVLLGGGVTGGGINMLIPKDAPDRYTGTMATHDWDDQSFINKELWQEINRLKTRCVVLEQKVTIHDYRIKRRSEISHTHPQYERKAGQ